MKTSSRGLWILVALVATGFFFSATNSTEVGFVLRAVWAVTLAIAFTLAVAILLYGLWGIYKQARLAARFSKRK